MASCFRNVTNRLCCSSYLKTPGITYLENGATGSSKLTHSIKFRKEKCDRVSTSNSISATTKLGFDNNSILTKSILIPSLNNSLSQDAVSWYKCQNTSQQRFPHPSGDAEKLLFLGKKKEIVPRSDPGRPTKQQLENILKVLSDELPKLFVRRLSYDIYSDDLIFENNIKGKRTVGLGQYVAQLALLKAVGHFRFAYVKCVILKITTHPEEGTVKVRWRIQGIDGFSVIFKFWNFKPHKMKDHIQDAPTWYDGFSIYSVGSDGRIYKHVVDKMMPDDDKVIEEKPGIDKLTMFLGLTQRSGQTLAMNALNKDYENSLNLCRIMPLEKCQ